MTQEVKMMVGIPGSGKSTWIEQEVPRIEEEHRTTCVISRDYIRFSMLDPERDDYFTHEIEVFDEFIRQINEAMELGIDVVFIDATHVSPGSRNKVLSKLLPDPHTNLTFEVIRVPVATALNRNAQREGLARVPNSAIQKMARSFRVPSEAEIPADNYGFNKINIKIHDERED